MSYSLFGSFSNTIGDLNKSVMNCKKCPYHMLKTNIDNRVNGSGSCDNGLMVIGQCPGPVEMEKGKPFIGTSGLLLKSIMKSSGILPSESRFTNIIRCLPPNGKNIIQKAIKQCSVWLEDEINLIKPKLIVCVGNIAGDVILGTDNIATDGGKLRVSKYNYIDGILTYHTAHLLRIKNSDKEEFEDKMKIVEEHWKKIALLLKISQGDANESNC